VRYVEQLEERLSQVFPEFFNGSAAARLRLRPDELNRRGLSLADGYRPAKGTPLALYFGQVVLDSPGGDYVLALDSFQREGRVWCPSVDAGPACRMPNPRLVNAALCNHSCHGATVRLRRPPELYGCALPCAVAYAADDMPLGGHLLWDYDGGSRVGNGTFSVDTALSIALSQAGVGTVRCGCSGLEPCPRNRWFSIYPGDPAS
jgi:hypothetical protein